MVTKFLIPCECGLGHNVFRTAGSFATFHGRDYYSCPHDKKSCSKIWVDELVTTKYAHLHPYLVEDNGEKINSVGDSKTNPGNRRFPMPASGFPYVGLMQRKGGWNTRNSKHYYEAPKSFGFQPNECNVSMVTPLKTETHQGNVNNWDAIICCFFWCCTMIISLILILPCLIVITR